MNLAPLEKAVSIYFPNGGPPALVDVAFEVGLAENAAGGGLIMPAKAFAFGNQYIKELAQSGDLSGYYDKAIPLLSNRYAQLIEYGGDTSSVLGDLQQLVNTANTYGLNPGDIANTINSTVNSNISDYNSRMANRDSG